MKYLNKTCCLVYYGRGAAEGPVWKLSPPPVKHSGKQGRPVHFVRLPLSPCFATYLPELSCLRGDVWPLFTTDHSRLSFPVLYSQPDAELGQLFWAHPPPATSALNTSDETRNSATSASFHGGGDGVHLSGTTPDKSSAFHRENKRRPLPALWLKPALTTSLLPLVKFAFSLSEKSMVFTNRGFPAHARPFCRLSRFLRFSAPAKKTDMLWPDTKVAEILFRTITVKVPYSPAQRVSFPVRPHGSKVASASAQAPAPP